jgi:hypothetical protein
VNGVVGGRCRAAEVHGLPRLFTTALGLYGGVLWSDELQGSIVHEMMPSGEVDKQGQVEVEEVEAGVVAALTHGCAGAPACTCCR